MRSDVKSDTKHSVVIGGHKTSVSLEEPFWNELRAIADAQRESVSNLLCRIDGDRQNANLSSAARVFVLRHHQSRSTIKAVSAMVPISEAEMADRLP